jgi:DNA-binding SARP family transcriptional activator
VHALQFRLLGKFAVYYNHTALDSFNVQKVQELLCYLLVHRDRPHHREVLAELLWNNANTPYSKKYLRKTLWQLQTALRSVPSAPSYKLLIIDPHWIQISKDALYWLDVSTIEDQFTSVRGKPGRALEQPEFDDLQQAVKLYKGDLLEGWFQDWCVYYRVRLREMFLDIVDKLLEYCEVNNLFDLGIEFGNIILGYDRARERTHQRIMRLYYTAGYRSAALQQYKICQQALREELEVKPSERTKKLYEQIMSDNLGPWDDLEVTNTGSNGDPFSGQLHKRLRRVEKLVRAQSMLQQRLDREIREIKSELETHL